MRAVPRLILCDGLPGSGKTTTVQQLWLHLESLGHDARWWFEHELGHPVIEYDRARQACQEGREEIRRVGARAHAGWAALAGATRGTTLLESTLFQTTMGSQLLGDLPRAEIGAHFERTMELIAPAAPALIYLRQQNVADALQAICARRGPWFFEYLQGEFAASARGRRVGRNDLAALADFFQERRDLSDELFARFSGRKLSHDNTAADWVRQGRAITDFLDLLPMKPPARPERAEEFAGRFRAETGDEWTIAADAAGLQLTGDHPARLLPHGRDRFVIQGLCVDLAFQRRAGDGAIEAIACTGNLPSLPPRWVKV